MAADRLFAMTCLLLQRGQMTAGELARHFEVSERTIYRDIDALSAAGVPVYAQKGRGGGLGLLEDYVLARTYLDTEEREALLTALESLQAVGQGGDSALVKLRGLFGRHRESWLEIEFSGWGDTAGLQQRFERVKTAILRRQWVLFTYYSAKGIESERTVWPGKLCFRGQDWYLCGWCAQRADWRYFKLRRMQQLQLDDRGRPAPTGLPPAPGLGADHRYGGGPELVLHIAAERGYRVLDEFAPEQVRRLPDGSFEVHVHMPEDEWLYGYLLSYGGGVWVKEPAHIARELARRAAVVAAELARGDR